MFARCMVVSFAVVFSVLSLCGACPAGFEEGRQAYDAGDFQKAFSILTPLAESGDVRSESLLGFIYETGIGARKDFGMAVKWYRQAAQNGDVEAMFKTGFLLGQGVYGLHHNYREAFEWYLKASALGHGQAKFNIANMYENGMGVTLDLEKAMEWYQDAAGHGIASGGDSFSRLSWGLSNK